MQTNNYNSRFKDAPWYDKSINETILVVGAGGIGSNAMHCLTKTIPATYIIVDDDKVEEYNIGTQFFRTDFLNKSKVSAVVDNAKVFGSLAKVIALESKYNPTMYSPIFLTGLDNMKTRKECFEEWRKHEDRELFIDGRLRSNLLEIYSVQKGQEALYEETLFDDSEIDDGACTFKQTAYMAMMIGAKMTNILVNYLINKYSEEPLSVVPFKIKEYSELFYREII
jgi:hypothetical protein